MKLMVQSEEENAVSRLLFFSQRTLVLSIERAKSMKYFDVLAVFASKLSRCTLRTDAVWTNIGTTADYIYIESSDHHRAHQRVHRPRWSQIRTTLPVTPPTSTGCHVPRARSHTKLQTRMRVTLEESARQFR